MSAPVVLRCACGARLSKYNATDKCGICDIEASAQRIRPFRARGSDTCQRGHDLTTTATYRNRGDGKQTRRCGECDRLRAIEYRLRKANA